MGLLSEICQTYKYNLPSLYKYNLTSLYKYNLPSMYKYNQKLHQDVIVARNVYLCSKTDAIISILILASKDQKLTKFLNNANFKNNAVISLSVISHIIPRFFGQQ